MGVDAVIRLATPPSPEFYPALAEKFSQDWQERPADEYGPAEPHLQPDGEVYTTWRYYGPGYERGPWPKIKGVIEWLWAHTEGDVTYGGDSADEWPVFTREDMAAIEAHYVAVGHEPYEAPFRRYER